MSKYKIRCNNIRLIDKQPSPYFPPIIMTGTGKERVGIIIDEFPYLVEAEASFPSLLQAVWDGKFKSANIFFAISGSCIGMMKEEVLMPKGPLYGRATGIVNLQPIDFFKLGEFFPKYSPVQLVEVYGITGGVPKYFEFISDGGPVLSNIEHAIKSRSTLLTAEADFLLHEEFRETRIYLACLRALGNGPLEVGHIAKIVGIDSKVLSKYFEQLIELKFIERRVPTGEDPAKSRKGRYAICDPFLRFYFRFITPHLQEIEKGQFNQILTCIRKEFDAYIGKHVFEKICRDWLSMRADKGKFSFVPEDIGSYWDKDIEIDILGINHHDQVMVVGEAKWTNEKVGADVISELEAKSKLLQGKKDYYCHLAVFSRSGFSSKVLEIAAKKNILLVSLKEMFGD